MTVLDVAPIETVDLEELTKDFHVCHIICTCCMRTACGEDAPTGPSKHDGPCDDQCGGTRCTGCEEVQDVFVPTHMKRPSHYRVCPHDWPRR